MMKSLCFQASCSVNDGACWSYFEIPSDLVPLDVRLGVEVSTPSFSPCLGVAFEPLKPTWKVQVDPT